MLDANLQTQLKAHFEKLAQPVTVVASIDDSAKSGEMLALLREIVALSPQLSLTERHDDTERKPSFALNRADGSVQIRFAGIPLGHEFTSLVLALLQTGGYPPKAEPAVIEQIRALAGPLHFETYISLSCHNCPEVVQALNMMATINPAVSSVMIDGALFQDEIDRHKIMAVPTIFLNGEPFGQGRMSVAEILAKVDTGSIARESEKLAAKQPFDVLIVGGGPAGSAAAIYAARKGIRTGVVAERFGGQVQDTLAIENLISVKETDGPKLAATLEANVKSVGVDVMNLQRVEALIPGALIELKLQSGASLQAKTVILAPGARWRELEVPGEKQYRARGVAYCPHCDGPLFKGKRVAVVGGGNSAVEAAIDLAGIVDHVTVLIRSQLRADTVLQNKLRALPNVTLLEQAAICEITGDGSKVTGIDFTEKSTDQLRHIDLEGVFVQIGLTPNSAWLKDTVELNENGEIVVDSHGRTSVPGVFAAGDATSSPFKQIIISMGDGAKASLSAFEYLLRH
ncbi:MAG: alkyl hydroperoxide reductase subunit F [Burkholderiaceae bacterium]|nr:alkyl hydroperoxide reductase subunit F [Burkholderiaceae bacterium]